ncbi:collagen-binding MSCRAMM adhesin Scm [Enterococcus faecium]|uniref:collagen-binding MSCRAMM adhesin Scm n=1 Tax=Enterococcus TaxID=1350 RepID=UPI000CF246DA|nr:MULTISPECIES: collagen-binding MSCRAMM adhesin Scm [Enterococcus]EME3493699.1 collagen-binding MSCRAMM adhesin Scm [Enterococcus faecium]EME3569328.1 collagen-binding MSCRAMM adhesin Scm [Enterococcus faecium]EME3596778.1 collagen-binding MSCRAMM adhesin Scm [Enterococcus faecium]EME7156667.1 collagen-binding MSCRAMM adhesin Scm [Enterococcus faecium]EME7175182.1 collagen-binding MSCRAMM adhesin Scm [Enterococcus faecium]
MQLFNIFSYGVAVSAETYIPKDPGNIYNDLTGNYGLLGIASQFHVFAKNKTTVNAHTDGNIATHELDAKNNFGTELHEGLLNQEINYIQKTDSFANSSGIPTGSTRMNKFVVGSNVDVALQDGHPTVNGSRLDHLTPDDFYKDRAGHEYIDFEQEFAKLNVAANDLATITPAKTYTAADFPDMNNRTIDLTGLSVTGFLLVNIDAEVLTMNTPLQIINPNDQVVVFNVINSSSALNVQSPIKYNDRSNHETEDFSDANISWNFGNEMTDLTISAPFQGTILAPNATIRITQNQDGTIIGTNVILDAATNRWDPNEIFISDNGTDTTDTSDSTDTSTTSDSSDSSTSSDSTDTTSTTSDSTDTSASSDSSDSSTTTNDSTDTSASSDSTDTTSTTSDSSDSSTTTSDSTDTSASSDSTDTSSITSDSSDSSTTTSDSTDTSASSDSTDTTSTTSDSSDSSTTTSDSTDTSASSDSTDTTSTTSDSSDSTTTTSDSTDTSASSDSTDTTSTTSDSTDTSASSDSTGTKTTSDSSDSSTTTSDSTDTSASSDSTDTSSTTSDSSDSSASSDSTGTKTTSDSSDSSTTTSDSTDTSASSDSTDTISTTSDSSDSSTSSDSTDTSSTTSDTRHASVSFSKTSSDNRTNFNLTNKTSNDNGNKSKRALPKTGSQSNNWITLAGVILLVIGLRITFMSYKKSKR